MGWIKKSISVLVYTVFNCSVYQTNLTGTEMWTQYVHNLLHVSILLEDNRQGAPDNGTKEVPKRVGDCVSVVFVFQCMYGWFDKLNFASCLLRTLLKQALLLSSKFEIRNCPVTSSESLQCRIFQYAVQGLGVDTVLQTDIRTDMTTTYGVTFF
jgi:hypothetical protein